MCEPKVLYVAGGLALLLIAIILVLYVMEGFDQQKIYTHGATMRHMGLKDQPGQGPDLREYYVHDHEYPDMRNVAFYPTFN